MCNIFFWKNMSPPSNGTNISTYSVSKALIGAYTLQKAWSCLLWNSWIKIQHLTVTFPTSWILA